MGSPGHCRRSGLKQRCNLLIEGPAGTGKTYLACALGAKCLRAGYPSALLPQQPPAGELHYRPRRRQLRQAALAQLAKTDVLILDDWGLEGLTPPQRNDLLEVIEDRHGRGSTLITSQLPVSKWHQTIGDPTLADAILDRLLHNAHRIKLEGESMRKKLAEVDSL
ncbi:ATP-binding protein [Microbulbifer sp. TYP-18]|uniref:ATP-binding protein n=1 Tax=Microbulbifer sp. TYP-18 TaxID=3230024 RepID=UPI0034C695BB